MKLCERNVCQNFTFRNTNLAMCRISRAAERPAASQSACSVTSAPRWPTSSDRHPFQNGSLWRERVRRWNSHEMLADIVLVDASWNPGKHKVFACGKLPPAPAALLKKVSHLINVTVDYVGVTYILNYIHSYLCLLLVTWGRIQSESEPTWVDTWEGLTFTRSWWTRFSGSNELALVIFFKSKLRLVFTRL